MSDYQKITYKTKDGTLKEQRFDDFNEFADKIEDAANDFYQTGVNPGLEIETHYGNITRKESITGGIGSPEFLRD